MKIWLDHLSTVMENRRRGAAKSAATRAQSKMSNSLGAFLPNVMSADQHSPAITPRQSSSAATSRRCRQSSSAISSGPEVDHAPLSADTSQDANTFCGTCRKEYEEETNESELWIGCDICQRWFHCVCEGLTQAPQEELWNVKTDPYSYFDK